MGKSRHQHGFTLVELAIVVSIIGLLVAAISLAGPQLMRSARTKSTIKDVIDLRQSVQQFRERFRFFPGDFPATAAELSGVAAACTTGSGTGLIDNGIESNCAVQHLVLAGLQRRDPITIELGDARLISRVDAEALYTAAMAVAPAATLPATVRNVILLTDLPCDAATSLDGAIDDGNLITGSGVRALGGACVAEDPIWVVVAL